MSEMHEKALDLGLDPPVETPDPDADEEHLVRAAAPLLITNTTLNDLVAERSHSSIPSLDADNEIFIPVHGFVELTDPEIAVVNHPAFQRLGSIYQLGQTHLVYRGATHRRLEHVLGTLNVAQKMVDAIHRNHRRARRKELSAVEGPFSPARLAAELTDVEETFIRLAALLHDVGHLPEGHTLEDELGFLDKHDKSRRIDSVLDRLDWPGGRVDPLRAIIDKEYAEWIESPGITPSELLIQIVAKDPLPNKLEAAKQVVRVGVCRDIVGNTICADLLDYLHRDWFHLGKPQYFDQRIFQYMEIRTDRDTEDKFVINLGSRPKIRTDAITAILRLLESRYELAESVLFHRTKCTAAAMLERALYEIETSVSEDRRATWKQGLEREFLDLSDEGVIDHLLAEADSLHCEAALRPLRALRQRRLYKGVETIFFEQLSVEHRQRLTRLYTGSSEAARARNNAMRVLERDFQLPEGSLAIYSPNKGMNAKVAEVKIHVNGHIAVFKDWDAREQVLSGGHIEAQLRRFSWLWRIHVGIDRHVWDAMSEPLRQCLVEAINTCVLGILSPGRTFEAASRALAAQLAIAPDGPYSGRQVEARSIAALGGQPESAYPTSAPAIRSFFTGFM